MATKAKCKGKTATGPCPRPVTDYYHFLGQWVATCPRHRAAYSDLPHRSAALMDTYR